MRGLFNAIAEIKRLQSYAGGKSSNTLLPGTIEGHFEPIDYDDNAVALNIQGQAFVFMCEGFEDIRKADTLVIDGKEYGVRGIARFNQKSVDYLRCYLELSATTS